MSGHGGHRHGSGRRRIYPSKKQSNIVWQRGHRRISIDHIVYSSWVAARIKCGYKTDSDFASHLLSLERRRRENDPVISNAKRKRRTEEEAAVPSKRQRHLSGHPLSTSTPVKPVMITVQSPTLSLDAVDATSDLDVTGISEFSVNNSTYQVANDSVILQNDSEKYQDSDNPLSDSDSDGDGDSNNYKEKTERAIADVLIDALHELDEDFSEEESYNSSEGTDIDDLEHTGSIECANNLTLAYTPKRCSYSYRSYKARKQLAAIDWNYHANNAAATTKAGDVVVSRKYNQRTKEWNSKVVKVKKQYEYIPVLMAKVLQLRKEDANKVTRNVPLNDSDPALLAPTIADKPPPPSRELFLARKSRFENHTNEN